MSATGKCCPTCSCPDIKEKSCKCCSKDQASCNCKCCDSIKKCACKCCEGTKGGNCKCCKQPTDSCKCQGGCCCQGGAEGKPCSCYSSNEKCCA